VRKPLNHLSFDLNLPSAQTFKRLRNSVDWGQITDSQYIQDVIVAEPFRGLGVGKALLAELFKHLQAVYPADCTIGLMAAKEQDGFYAQFGFTARPSDVYGAGMMAPLGKISLDRAKG